MAYNSLKKTIIVRLLIPVICFILLETSLSYSVTLHYVDKTYDSQLLNSALSLKQEIKVKDNKIYAELSENALEIFTWNNQDKTYFKITSKKQGQLAGDIFLTEPLIAIAQHNSQPIFSTTRFHNQLIRMVSIQVKSKDLPETVSIHVAETLNKRHDMAMDILLADLIPQILFTLLISLYLFRSVIRGLSPLHHLTDQLAQRSPYDLSPLNDSHIFSEVRALTDTINQLLARLSTAISAQQRFISNAAHQLRTPIAGLKLQTEVALREDNVNTMRPALHQMQTSTNRIAHLITQLLALARSSPIECSHTLEHLDLRALVRESCINWVPEAINAHIELSFDDPKQEIWIRGDAILLNELLANLISNAIAYGQSQIIVKLISGTQPMLSIEDDGAGIPMIEQDKIFERFYRIQGTPSEGCGLGLAIVKEIVQLHHAKIQLSHSQQLTGACFKVIFSL